MRIGGDNGRKGKVEDGKFQKKKPACNDLKLKPVVDPFNGSQWHAAQVYRAINQALGRCIRHQKLPLIFHDWGNYSGTIILLQERFREEEHQAGLSKWVAKSCKVETYGFKAAMNSLSEFMINRIEIDNALSSKETKEQELASSSTVDTVVTKELPLPPPTTKITKDETEKHPVDHREPKSGEYKHDPILIQEAQSILDSGFDQSNPIVVDSSITTTENTLDEGISVKNLSNLNSLALTDKPLAKITIPTKRLRNNVQKNTSNPQDTYLIETKTAETTPTLAAKTTVTTTITKTNELTTDIRIQEQEQNLPNRADQSKPEPSPTSTSEHKLQPAVLDCTPLVRAPQQKTGIVACRWHGEHMFSDMKKEFLVQKTSTDLDYFLELELDLSVKNRARKKSCKVLQVCYPTSWTMEQIQIAVFNPSAPVIMEENEADRLVYRVFGARCCKNSIGALIYDTTSTLSSNRRLVGNLFILHDTVQILDPEQLL
ncbi:hypothetical protein F4703DRAFT_1797174 [Phycomyces blakesleeanus]